jgi:hypothetical protein
MSQSSGLRQEYRNQLQAKRFVRWGGEGVLAAGEFLAGSPLGECHDMRVSPLCKLLTS